MISRHGNRSPAGLTAGSGAGGDDRSHPVNLFKLSHGFLLIQGVVDLRGEKNKSNQHVRFNQVTTMPLSYVVCELLTLVLFLLPPLKLLLQYCG